MNSSDETAIRYGIKQELYNVLPHVYTPKLYIIDWDGTLNRTFDKPGSQPTYESAVGRLILIGKDFGVDPAAIQEAQTNYNPFDPLQIIKEKLSSDTKFKMFRECFTDPSLPSMLYPDAKQFLDSLAATPSTPHLVLTFGKNAEWQKLKIAASNYKGHVVITDESKAKVIKRWQDPKTGRYEVVGFLDETRPVARYSTSEAVMIDDKESSLQDLPGHCTPIYLQRSEEHAAKQLPAGTTTVNQLTELTVAKTAMRIELHDHAPLSDDWEPHATIFVPTQDCVYAGLRQLAIAKRL